MPEACTVMVVPKGTFFMVGIGSRRATHVLSMHLD